MSDTIPSIDAYPPGDNNWNITNVNGEGQQYGLYPNPNSGNFMLQQMTKDDKPVDVEIWDVVGRSVYKNSVTFSGGRAELRIEHAAPGIYLIKVIDSQQRKYRFKFLVK